MRCALTGTYRLSKEIIMAELTEEEMHDFNVAIEAIHETIRSLGRSESTTIGDLAEQSVTRYKEAFNRLGSDKNLYDFAHWDPSSNER